jgi:arsenate reductase
MNDKRPLNVLFLCTGNSARSIMAEAIINRVGMGKFKGYSAGSMPTGKVHPMALELLNRLNYDTSNARSKSWEEFSVPGAPELDFVFTVCDNAANEVCPIWPGQPMSAHWACQILSRWKVIKLNALSPSPIPTECSTTGSVFLRACP